LFFLFLFSDHPPMASHKTATLLLVAVAALGLAALTYPMTYRSELLWSGRQVAGAGTSAPALLHGRAPFRRAREQSAAMSA
jgi:hypothetical protein